MNAVAGLQNFIEGAAREVGPAVVGLGRGWGFGSGVVISQGRVLTSAHNLRRDGVTVVFADERREQATVAGTDPDGRRVVTWSEPSRTHAQLVEDWSRADADAYLSWARARDVAAADRSRRR